MTRLLDRARDAPGVALLAVAPQDVGQLVDADAPDERLARSRRPSDPCACRAAPSSRNEKPRSPRSSCGDETPRSSTKPSIGTTPEPREDRARIAERAVHQRHALAERRQPRARRRQRRRIAIDADEPPVGRRRPQDALGMPAAAERGVAIDPARARREQRQGLVGHDRSVSELGAHSTVKPPTARRR